MARQACQFTRGQQPWYLFLLGRALKASGQEREAAQAFQDCLAKSHARHMPGLERMVRGELKSLASGEKEGKRQAGDTIPDKPE